MSFLELARDRYSVRNFQDRPVEPRLLNEILEAGRIALTAHNDQPQRIKIITDPVELAKVDECTRCRFGAQTVLLVCYDKDVCWRRKFDDAPSGEIDAAIVTTHIILAAYEAGVGTCWVMYFDPVKTTELFGLPENIVPVAFLPMGYPSEDSTPAGFHDKRISLEEMLLK